MSFWKVSCFFFISSVDVALYLPTLELSAPTQGVGEIFPGGGGGRVNTWNGQGEGQQEGKKPQSDNTRLLSWWKRIAIL